MKSELVEHIATYNILMERITTNSESKNDIKEGKIASISESKYQVHIFHDKTKEKFFSHVKCKNNSLIDIILMWYYNRKTT